MRFLHVVLLDNQPNTSKRKMWTLEFHVTQHNMERCESKIYRHKVDADKMFRVIKYGAFHYKDRTYFLCKGDEGRSPRNGIRIFKEVDLWDDSFEG